jgi:hypothetical protein
MKIEESQEKETIKLEKEISKKDTQKKTFEEQLFEHYPSFIYEDYKQKRIVLINGINYENLPKTEIAYFLSKDPQRFGIDKRKIRIEEIERPKFPIKETFESEEMIIEEDSFQKKKKNLTQDQREEDGKKTFCICKQVPGEHEGQMVFCDNCKEWYHPLCARISKIEISLINSCEKNRWYCRKCLTQKDYIKNN